MSSTEDPEVVRARIFWTDEAQRAGLSDRIETTDPAWLEAKGEGWSLRCSFSRSPRQQGSPSECEVEFVSPSAPHTALKSGVGLELFERATGGRARVEIL